MSDKYLVFGATGAIGSSLAKQLHESNHGVHLVARNEEEVKEIANELDCSYSIADVLEENFIEKIKADTADFNIKGVAYCVGSIDLKPIKRVSEGDMHACMKLNLYSAIEVIKGFQEDLKKNSGSIVLFSSVAAQKGFTNHTIIATAKAAIEGLTVTLAAEFAPNIRVNCIAPSLTNSKIAQPMLKNPIVAEALAKAHPLKRVGEGKDSASIAKFLLSEESSWVTGQIIGVDGGRLETNLRILTNHINEIISNLDYYCNRSASFRCHSRNQPLEEYASIHAPLIKINDTTECSCRFNIQLQKLNSSVTT